MDLQPRRPSKIPPIAGASAIALAITTAYIPSDLPSIDTGNDVFIIPNDTESIIAAANHCIALKIINNSIDGARLHIRDAKINPTNPVM